MKEQFINHKFNRASLALIETVYFVSRLAECCR